MKKKNNVEYVYIRTTEQSTTIHFGTTTDYKKRYKVSADEIEDKNKYLYIFECNVGTGHKIEADFKRVFKDYLVERELYLWNNLLKEKYLHFIRLHKDSIKEIEVPQEKNVKVIKKVIKVKSNSRNLKEMGWTMKDMQMSAQRVAKQLQKDNKLTSITNHDEFYTRYEDVEKVVGKFEKEFKNKVVFCNCDDVLDNNDNNCSAFALYFKKNFKKLKLKKLICTHFVGVANLFNQTPVGLIYNYDGSVIEIKKGENGYDGSFYHPLSVKILNEEADICCTNHPWSLTEKFYDILYKSKKKFLVISNSGIVLIPRYFNKIKDKTMRLIERCEEFYNKNKIKVRATGGWFTNFETVKYSEYKKLLPLKNIPESFIKIDDNGILNIDGGYIPADYNKVIAISTAPIVNGILEKGFDIIPANEYFKCEMGGEPTYQR